MIELNIKLCKCQKLNNETIWIFKNQTVKAIMRGSKKIKVIKFTYMYIKLTKKGFGLPLFELSLPPPQPLFLEKKSGSAHAIHYPRVTLLT